MPVETEVVDGVTPHASCRGRMLRHREGFALTDPGTDLAGALDQANYCIWCHNQGKDSCSQRPEGEGPAPSRRAPFGVTLAGCPLEEKISEMHLLKARGLRRSARWPSIAVDNPMLAATGHRICNDCMKSCIYQKQEPVDIPQAETRTLKDVLDLPWGFEIYCLLTRWNPLNLRAAAAAARRPAARCWWSGLGPAGFTLAHHLMNDGHTVVGDRRPEDRAAAGRASPASMRRRHARALPADPRRRRAAARISTSRVMAGFGGVAEYGITVRWDKNFLKIDPPAAGAARAVRACSAACASAARSPSTSAFALGFDHIALCAGRRQADRARHAERPGARRAHGLRLPDGAAAHRRGQDRLDRQPAAPPAGGGDRRRPDRDRHRDRVAGLLPACRSRSSSPATRRWRPSAARRRCARLDTPRSARSPTSSSPMPAPSAPSAQRAAREGRDAALADADQRLGRRHHRLSPPPDRFARPTRLNHEEVEKALEEGIRFAEGLTPVAVEVDALRPCRGDLR